MEFTWKPATQPARSGLAHPARNVMDSTTSSTMTGTLLLAARVLISPCTSAQPRQTEQLLPQSQPRQLQLHQLHQQQLHRRSFPRLLSMPYLWPLAAPSPPKRQSTAWRLFTFQQQHSRSFQHEKHLGLMRTCADMLMDINTRCNSLYEVIFILRHLVQRLSFLSISLRTYH